MNHLHSATVPFPSSPVGPSAAAPAPLAHFLPAMQQFSFLGPGSQGAP